MRRLAGLALALCLVSAGCLGVGGDDEPEGADATGGAQAALPAPIHDERNVEMKASPLGTAQGQPCETDASSCYRYGFDLAEDGRVQARLDWTNATNDFDLHVVDDGGQRVASSNTGPPGTQETIDATLEPGTYRLVVVAWAVQQDTYVLDAQFGYP